VRGGDQGGVVCLGHGPAGPRAQPAPAHPVEEPARLPGPHAGQGGDRGSAPIPGRSPGRPACARGGPRCVPPVAAALGRTRPQSRSTPRSPPLASYLGPGHSPPGGDRVLVPLSGPVRRDLRREPHPVQQVRHAPQRVRHVKQPGDQRSDPGQRPPLIGVPAVHRRARRHWYTDFVLTRKILAIRRASMSCSNSRAACSRTCSRRARPSAVSPPPSEYLMPPA